MSAGPTLVQLQRWRFVESLLLWEGSIQRSDICEAFHLTPNHVTREITSYRKKHRKNLIYDTETGAWRASPDFVAAYATGDANEYLTMLHAYALSGERSVLLKSGPAVVAETLPEAVGKIERPVLREIIVALKRGQGVQVRYQSFSEPLPTDRLLYPHALVFAHGRWHIRAYDNRKERFGDFVLTRILKARAATERAQHSVVEDRAWHDQVVVEVVPTSTLSASQKAAIVREYGMRQRGELYSWKITLRSCLVKYFLQAHRLDLPAEIAEHRRIALRDPGMANDYAFTDD